MESESSEMIEILLTEIWEVLIFDNETLLPISLYKLNLLEQYIPTKGWNGR